MTITTAEWFPVVALVIGFLLSSTQEWFRDTRTLKRDRESREAERRERLRERRADFQRETLLALQDAAQDLVRATGAIAHHDTMEHRKTGEWGKQLVGEELNQKCFMAMRQTLILNVRVRDERVRTLVETLRGSSSGAVRSRSKDDCDSALQAMTPVFDEFNKRIGTLLRSIDDQEQ